MQAFLQLQLISCHDLLLCCCHLFTHHLWFLVYIHVKLWDILLYKYCSCFSFCSFFCCDLLKMDYSNRNRVCSSSGTFLCQLLLTACTYCMNQDHDLYCTSDIFTIFPPDASIPLSWLWSTLSPSLLVYLSYPDIFQLHYWRTRDHWQVLPLPQQRQWYLISLVP